MNYSQFQLISQCLHLCQTHETCVIRLGKNTRLHSTYYFLFITLINSEIMKENQKTSAYLL